MRTRMLTRPLMAVLAVLAVVVAAALAVPRVVPVLAADGAEANPPVEAVSAQADQGDESADQAVQGDEGLLAPDASDEAVEPGWDDQPADPGAADQGDATDQADQPGATDAPAQPGVTDQADGSDAAEDAGADAPESQDAGAQAQADSAQDADGETTGAASSAADEAAAAVPMLAPAADPDGPIIYVDGDNGDDGNSGISPDAPLKSLFVAGSKAGGLHATQIRARGNLSIDRTAIIPSGTTLVIEADTNVTPAGANNGITLQSGASLTCENGATLTMSGFSSVALSVNAGGVVNDGTYVLDGNTMGLSLAGDLRGSSRSALYVSVQGCNGPAIAIASTAKVVSSTVVVESTNNKGDIETGLYLEDSNFSSRGVWYYFNSALTLQAASNFTVEAAAGYSQAMTISNQASISGGSTVSVSGSRVSVSTTMDITEGSTFEVTDSTRGGLNINRGNVTVSDSTLRFSGMSGIPAYGVSRGGSLTIEGDSLVVTPAADPSVDNGGVYNGSYYVVGGSFAIAYDGSNYNATTPTNGSGQGAERLHLFTLADPGVSSLTAVTSGGDTYEYPVANANPDGSKRVWVPAFTVTFQLNDPDAADQVSASFADGSTAAKTALTMRGYGLSAASSVVQGSTAAPADPIAAGYQFNGWFYKDGTPFSADDPVSADTTVYAKWTTDASSYGVNYRVNYGGQDAVYSVSLSRPDRTATVAGVDQAAAANAAFSLEGRNFIGWNTAADGSGTAYAPGDTLTVPQDVVAVELYAQWDLETATVRFSANGGTFAEGSLFKQRADLFEVTTDANGGEVATLKATALKVDNKTLDNLIASIDPAATANSLGLSSTSQLDDPSSLATRDYYDLGCKTETFFGVLTNYFYWFSDPTGAKRVAVSGYDPITTDRTYYLKWDLKPTVLLDGGNLVLGGDIYGSSADTSSAPDYVRSRQDFSLTGAVDVDVVKSQMSDLEDKYSITADQYADISLAETGCTITAKLKLAPGIDATGATVTVDGLGDVFDAATSVEGDTVTATFVLKTDSPDAARTPRFATYADLKAAIDGLPNTLTATLSGLKLTGDVNNEQKLVSTGTVEGTFSSIADLNGTVVKFDYELKGAQTDAGRDVDADDQHVIQFTDVAVVPVQANLPADMLVDGNTENIAAYEVLPGDAVTLSGAIDTSPILAQMELIEAQYPGHAFTDIAVQVNDATFVANIQLPSGIAMTPDMQVTPENFGDGFQVVDVQSDNAARTVQVTMKLRDGIENYQQLKDAVSNAGIDAGDGHKFMTVSISGLMVDHALPAGALLTATGTVSGHFDGIATVPSGTRHDFVFDWTGAQIPELKDAATPAGDTAISVSVLTVSTSEQSLPADLLADGDTEHEAVLQVAPGATPNLTGAVDVTGIKDQMSAIEAQYGVDDHSTIAIDVNNFTFTATLTLPEGVTVDPGLTAADVTGADLGGFVVDGVSVDGQVVTVSFALASQVDNYSQLEALVDPAGGDDGWMSVTVPVQVASDLAGGTQLTFLGDVQGSFSAAASMPAAGVRHLFSFAWFSHQWADGRDAAAPEGDDSIRLTMQVKTPDAPSSSENDKPSSSKDDNGGSSSSQNDKPSSSENDKPSSSKDDNGGSSSNSADKPSASADRSADKPGRGIPHTGDSTALGSALAAGLAGAAVIGAGAVLAARRREQR